MPNKSNLHFFKLVYDGRISYLLGTNHIVPLHRLHPKIQSLASKMQTLILESDLTEDNTTCILDNISLLQFPEHFLATEDEKWNERLAILPIEIKKSLKEIALFITQGIEPPIPLEKFQPWYLADTFSHRIQILTQHQGMDTGLCELMKYKGSIYELDTNEMEVETTLSSSPLKNLTQSELIDAITESYEQEAEYKACYSEFCEAYLEKDLNTLSSYMESNEEQTSQEYYNDVIKRNLQWITNIVHYHLYKPVPFFAMGFGHLAGAEGVLNILSLSGFKISQMNAEGNFIPYYSLEKLARTAAQLHDEQQNFQLLKAQILEPATKNISWLYTAASNRINLHAELASVLEKRSSNNNVAILHKF